MNNNNNNKEDAFYSLSFYRIRVWVPNTPFAVSHAPSYVSDRAWDKVWQGLVAYWSSWAWAGSTCWATAGGATCSRTWGVHNRERTSCSVSEFGDDDTARSADDLYGAGLSRGMQLGIVW
ncbi:hypothetical protein CDAR_386531 [Caerostris darwini]|uniref:Uncharacterized protein n=1 Tax=Caerostris darwini TaxID=1538125 RepID=A0AAV4QHK3_9ARAC|nr:hypothetical protein CDAR_386531 [Caerostris darwini]